MPSGYLLNFLWMFVFFLLIHKNFYKMRILTIIYHICCYFFQLIIYIQFLSFHTLLFLIPKIN